MNLDVLESRVARLEEINSSIPLLSQRMEMLSEKLAELVTQGNSRYAMLQEVRDRVMQSGPQCPKPGMCLGLEGRVVVLEKNIEAMKLESEVVAKGWRSAGVIVAVLTGLAGALVGVWKLIELVVHKKGTP